MSNLPNPTTGSFGSIPGSPEENGCNIHVRSPLDRHFPSDNAGRSTLTTTRLRLQEIGGNKPRYFWANSIVSNVALITTPHTEPALATSPLVSTLPEPTTTPEQEKEPEECSAGVESHPSSVLHSAGSNTVRSRASQASRSLSTITLPSFISSDQPRPHSSSVGMQIESASRPIDHHRRGFSIFGQRFGKTGSVSPVNDEDTGCKRSRPASSSLQIITSVLKGSGSTTSPVRSLVPPSRRSSRHSSRRLNLSPGSEDEAAIQWERLPPLARGILPASSSQNHTVNGAEELSTERFPSYCENEPRPQVFLATHVPLPPSPSMLSSSASSLTYAPPSSEDIPPINGFTAPYVSYPPLPPSIPSTPGTFSYPPTTHSTDRFADAHTVHRASRTVSLVINTLRPLSGEVGRTHSNLSTPTTTTTLSASPGNDSGCSPRGPGDSVIGPPVHHGSAASAHSQYPDVQELVPPPPPLPIVPLNPPLHTSPRGPRPLLTTPAQLNRSATMYSQTSSTGQ